MVKVSTNSDPIRVKKNLAVFYPEPIAEIVESAKRLLGEQYVIDLDSYNDGKDG